MSGGIAYLWDPDGENARRVNSDMVALRPVSDDPAARADRAPSRADGQRRRRRLLADWDTAVGTVHRGDAARPAAHRRRARPRAGRRPWLTRADSSRCSAASPRCARRSSACATTATCTCTRPRTRCAIRPPLHVVRRPVLPQGLPARQPDPRLERLRAWPVEEATERLHSTNSFPELTGKLCPAPCEEACVLTINDDAVTIKEIEWAIVERAWEEGWIVAPARRKAHGADGRRDRLGPGRTRRRPAARARRPRGHGLRARRPRGGLLRYGIPDFKLEKELIDRRVAQLIAEGVEFASASTRRRRASTSCAPATTPSCWRPAPSGTAARRSRRRTGGRAPRNGLSRAAEPPRRGPARRRTRAERGAGCASPSSAAAIRARTASAT